jgi:hypothetical protein
VPAYVQRLAFEAFDTGVSDIDEAVAERAVTTVLKRERQYFEVIYEDLGGMRVERPCAGSGWCENVADWSTA